MNEQYKYLETLRDMVYDISNTINNILEIEFYIGGEIPYLAAKYSNNGNVYGKKFFCASITSWLDSVEIGQ